MPRYTIVRWTAPAEARINPISEALGSALSMASLGHPEEALEMGLYEAGATVEAETPENLFVRTQSLDAPWTTLTPVLKGSRLNQRSTSVGDFIVDEEGKVLLCAAVGWKEPAPEIAGKVRAMAETFNAAS